MNERQLQFRVGLFVFTALAIAVVLVLRFTDVQRYWRETYRVAVHFNDAPGVYRGTPVRLNGVPIGAVADIVLDDDEPGVLVVVEIHGDRRLRKDAQPVLVRSLFGDATIEFSSGSSTELLPPNKRLKGEAAGDPLEAVGRLEQRVDQTLAAFQETSQQWGEVARNLNRLVDTHEGHLDDVIERAAVALESFTRTMETADRTLTQAGNLLADPQLQQNLRDVTNELPALARETRQTIGAARETVVAAKTSIQKISESLDHISAATDPLAQHSARMTARLDHSLAQLDSFLTELNTFAQLINTEKGSMQRLARDPELYENLNRSAESMAVVLRNLEPILADVRIFSDKIARHPELLGVSGALKGSTGVKEATTGAVQQAGAIRIQR
ncbi:MAG: MCE family protein [Planctomyces sp.]|nr:MCE family protein [Planctomyces sp.]